MIWTAMDKYFFWKQDLQQLQNLQEAEGQPCLENNSKVPDGEDTEDCEGFYPNELAGYVTSKVCIGIDALHKTD